MKEVFGIRVAVEPIIEEKTESGLFLPTSVIKNKSVCRGVVKVIGNKVTEELKVGDIVYYSKHSAIEVEIDSKPLFIVREGDLLYKD